MLFAIRFTDKPDCISLRERYLDEHLVWLHVRRNHIHVAGSLRETADSSPLGGLWIVEANSRHEVEKLYASDPFWVNGLRENVEILNFSSAFSV